MLRQYTHSKRLVTSKDVQLESIDHYRPKVFKTGLKSKQNAWIIGKDSEARTAAAVAEQEADRKQKVHKRVNRSVGGLTQWVEARLEKKYADWREGA